jgi:ubiquinone/menaquinone biosynthesis C-methylase UbiE
MPSTFVDPKSVVAALSIEPGSSVADFGCGTGYFSIECAKAVGDEGRVYAIDVLPSALESVESQAKTLGIRNITAKRANLERENGSGLEPNRVDWVIAKDLFFQNKDRETIMREIGRVLRPGGRALLMEWSKDDVGVGPDAESRVSQSELRSLAETVGFSVERDIQVGAFHYAFVIKKA